MNSTELTCERGAVDSDDGLNMPAIGAGSE